MPDVSGLVTTAVLNTKIDEVEDKSSDVSDLVKKTVYDAKISEIKGNYFTAADYNKFTSNIIDEKTEQKKLVNESIISNIVKIFKFNKKLEWLATKSELKVEQDKIVKQQTQDSSYFLGKYFFSDVCFQSIIVYQPTHLIR